MISELSFCRVACDLTKEQSERMARRAGVIIEEAAARTAAIELKIARRGGNPPCRRACATECRQGGSRRPREARE